MVTAHQEDFPMYIGHLAVNGRSTSFIFNHVIRYLAELGERFVGDIASGLDLGNCCLLRWPNSPAESERKTYNVELD